MNNAKTTNFSNILLGLYIASYVAIPANGVDDILGFNIHPIILSFALLSWLFRPNRINVMSKKYIGMQVLFYLAFIISSFQFNEPNYYAQTMNYVYNILFILLLCQVPKKENINYFLYLFVYGALLNSLLICLGQILDLHVIKYGGLAEERITILGRDNNEAAMIQCFSTAMALYFIRRKERVILNLVSIVMSAWMILLTGSRTGLIAVLLLVAYNVLSRERTAQKRIVQLVISVLIVVAGYYFFNMLGDTIIDRYINIGDEMKEGTMANRTLIWEKCVDTFINAALFNQIFGHGYGTTTLHTFMGYDAHNVFLKILVEYGVLGEILFLFYLTYFVRSAIRMIIKEEKFLIFSLLMMVIISFLTLSWIYNIIIWLVFILMHQKIRFQKTL